MLFLAELNSQPDNVIDTLYADCLREADYQAELRRIRANEKHANY